MKAIMAKDAFLCYPDHNKPFDIFADASDTQFGTVIFQDGAPAFFSRKLNSAQRNYNTGGKEILSVVETLKEFHTLLYGCSQTNVHTDHKCNFFTKQSNQRVLRWCLFLEDYGINFQYIKGCHNHLADALSCLPFNERQKDLTAIRQLNMSNGQYTNHLMVLSQTHLNHSNHSSLWPWMMTIFWIALSTCLLLKAHSSYLIAQ
jgi:RNase H-like domain found in reverse transcriptase